MAHDPLSMTFYVGSADELNAAIANIDAIGKTGNAGGYTIQFTQSITLSGTGGGTYAEVNADGTTGAALTIDTGTTPCKVAGSSQLKLAPSVKTPTVTIDGAGCTRREQHRKQRLHVRRRRQDNHRRHAGGV